MKQHEWERRRLLILEGQVAQQKQSFAAIERMAALYQEKCTQLLETFFDDLQRSKAQLHNLYTLAAKQAQWPKATLQLQESMKQYAQILYPGPGVSQIIQQITAALDLNPEEYLNWLYQLSMLHQQKENLTREVDMALKLEKEKQSAVTSGFKQFKDARRHFTRTVHYMHKILENAMHIARMQEDAQTLAADSWSLSTTLPDLDAGETQPFATFGQESLLLVSATKRDLADAVGHISRQMARIQEVIDDLQIELSMRDVSYVQLQLLHEQKKLQRDALQHAPAASRMDAQRILLAHGITSFPLFALLDFTPAVEAKEADSIEGVLKDAGLLDALVLLEQDIPAADALMRERHITDYRLKIDSPDASGPEEALPLGFDRAAGDLPGMEASVWEALVTRLLPSLAALLSREALKQSPPSIGKGRHAPRGQGESEPVRLIGCSTRLLAYQEELEALHRKLLNVDGQCYELYQKIAQQREKRENLQRALTQLQRLIAVSGMDEAYSNAQAKYLLLEQAQRHFQEARLSTSQKHQQYVFLVTRLEEVSFSHPLFVQQYEKVQTAQRVTESLAYALPFACRDLQRLIWLTRQIEETRVFLVDIEQMREGSLLLLQQLQAQLFQEEECKELPCLISQAEGG